MPDEVSIVKHEMGMVLGKRELQQTSVGLREWSLITGRGAGEVLPLQKKRGGGSEKGSARLKGGGGHNKL